LAKAEKFESTGFAFPHGMALARARHGKAYSELLPGSLDDVNVTLTVAPAAAVLTIAPQSLTFNYSIGGGGKGGRSAGPMSRTENETATCRFLPITNASPS
jgi:hypothetical protein